MKKILGGNTFRFLLCVLPALRVMLMNFHCHGTKTFFAMFFCEKTLILDDFGVRKCFKKCFNS